MENKLFDKIFEQIIEESIPIYEEREKSKEKNEKLETDDIKFSDNHNKVMKKMIKELKITERKRKVVYVTKRVAIIIICVVAALTCLIGSVEAWRKEVVKFIMKNNSNNYMNISFGNPDENPESGDSASGDDNSTTSGELIIDENGAIILDDIKFMYVPEGFEIKKEKNDGKSNYYRFYNDRQYICLKKELIDQVNKSVDIENVIDNAIVFSDKEVYKVKKENNRIGYVWYTETHVYNVYSNIENEEVILKFIENTKILKNF